MNLWLVGDHRLGAYDIITQITLHLDGGVGVGVVGAVAGALLCRSEMGEIMQRKMALGASTLNGEITA